MCLPATLTSSTSFVPLLFAHRNQLLRQVTDDYFQANDPSAPLGGSVAASAGDGAQSKKKQYWPGEDDDDVDKSSSKPGVKSAKDNKQKVGSARVCESQCSGLRQAVHC